jgi:hypothetical protein
MAFGSPVCGLVLTDPDGIVQKDYGNLPSCLFVPENMMTAFCPYEYESRPFQDPDDFLGSQRGQFRQGPRLSGYIQEVRLQKGYLHPSR